MGMHRYGRMAVAYSLFSVIPVLSLVLWLLNSGHKPPGIGDFKAGITTENRFCN